MIILALRKKSTGYTASSENSMKKVVIGITLDFETKPGYSVYPWYALRENYSKAVSHQGAIPLLLPHEEDHAEAYAEMIDGLVLTGGDFDIDPSLYGAAFTHEKVTTKHKRTQFEIALTKAMLQRNKPILGICAGEQLLNVLLGGTLIQHIPDSIPNCLEHEQKNPRHEPGHSLTVTPDTLLHRIVNQATLEVNSSHHQAVETVGKDVIINARAPDGVIEGIEYTKHPFCLGVEWHPEYESSESDRAIFRALVAAART